MPESIELDQSEAIVAIWQVAGATYKDLYESALKDAQEFMIGYDSWRFFVAFCSPHEFSQEEEVIDGSILTWKGQAVIKWMTESEISEYQKADETFKYLNSL